jgi:hypothetical protein
VTAPHPWRAPARIRACRPKPSTDAPATLADSKVGQLLHLVRTCGALELVEAELAGRPGPDGLPVEVVLTGLLLALHYHDSAQLAVACRVLLDELTDTAKTWLGIHTIDRTDLHKRIAFCKRVYLTFDRLTAALDPERVDRRRRLPRPEADAHAAWEDSDPEHARRRAVLQQVSDAFVLAPVRHARDRGWFKGWPGDVGVDMTGVPAWHHPPSDRRELGSIETTAGWHYSAGDTEGVFGHSLTLTVAASRHSHGQRISRHPQLALGGRCWTPAANARAPTPSTPCTNWLPSACRSECWPPTAPTTTEHFQTHARRLGYQLALDYEQEHRGIQGTTRHGALLIDGTLACPLTPHRAATATTGLDDKQIREIDTNEDLKKQIAAREPFHLKRKQGPDQAGTIRLQMPRRRTLALDHLPALQPNPPARTSRADRHRPDRPPGRRRPPRRETRRPDHPSRTPPPAPAERTAENLPEADDHRPPRRPGQTRQVPTRPRQQRGPQRPRQGTPSRPRRAETPPRPRPRRPDPPGRPHDLHPEPADPPRLETHHRHHRADSDSRERRTAEQHGPGPPRRDGTAPPDR